MCHRLLERCASLSFVLGIATFALINNTSAAPIVFNLNGTAHVLASAPANIEKTAPITSLGSGSLDADDPISLISAHTAWTLTADDNAAHLQFDLQAFGGRGGEGTADGSLKFTTAQKTHFKLAARFLTDYGASSFGDIDGQRVGFSFNFMNPEPGGEKTLEGDLEAGEHTFLASSFAPQTRSNPLRGDGSVSLDLSAQVAAIPLPPALVPGAIVLVGLGLPFVKRRLRKL